MNLNDMLNIDKTKSIEDKLKDAIKETLKELNQLNKEQTCMIYCDYLYRNLRRQHLLSKVIDTQDDLKLDYKHRFIITISDKEDSYYLVDLTYSQFQRQSIKELYDNGYKLISKDNSDEFKSYLMDVSGIVPLEYPDIKQTFFGK